MINVAQHIEYLLMHHDCVVVPGFGAFMINRESARYDSLSQTFLPPSLSLGFNPEVRHNDALLVGSISRRESISLDAARSELDTEMASMRYQLQLNGEIAFGNLGFFHPGSTSDAPVFSPSTDSLPLRACAGLMPIAVKPLAAETDDEVAEPTIVEVDEREPVVIPMPLKIVASIVAVMVGLGVLYSTTSLVNSPKVNFASLDSGIGTHIERVIDSTVSVSREILLNIATPPAESSNSANGTTSVATAVNGERNRIGRYLLVVGSFPSRTLAERHISEVGDQTLSIIEMDGNYRIYAASASRINDARSLASSLSARYPSVWVCRR